MEVAMRGLAAIGGAVPWALAALLVAGAGVEAQRPERRDPRPPPEPPPAAEAERAGDVHEARRQRLEERRAGEGEGGAWTPGVLPRGYGAAAAAAGGRPGAGAAPPGGGGWPGTSPGWRSPAERQGMIVCLTWVRRGGGWEPVFTPWTPGTRFAGECRWVGSFDPALVTTDPATAYALPHRFSGRFPGRLEVPGPGGVPEGWEPGAWLAPGMWGAQGAWGASGPWGAQGAWGASGPWGAPGPWGAQGAWGVPGGWGGPATWGGPGTSGMGGPWPPSQCVEVRLETEGGAEYRFRVEPSQLGARGAEEVELRLEAQLARRAGVVVPTLEGWVFRLPAGVVLTAVEARGCR
jgi:hypothetical protein